MIKNKHQNKNTIHQNKTKENISQLWCRDIQNNIFKFMKREMGIEKVDAYLQLVTCGVIENFQN